VNRNHAAEHRSNATNAAAAESYSSSSASSPVASSSPAAATREPAPGILFVRLIVATANLITFPRRRQKRSKPTYDSASPLARVGKSTPWKWRSRRSISTKPAVTSVAAAIATRPETRCTLGLRALSAGESCAITAALQTAAGRTCEAHTAGCAAYLFTSDGGTTAATDPSRERTASPGVSERTRWTDAGEQEPGANRIHAIMNAHSALATARDRARRERARDASRMARSSTDD
jgi:hypothetical protein